MIIKAALTWKELNDTLRTMTNEKDVDALLKAHRAVGASSRWTTRIHARYRQLVAKRLRREAVALGPSYRGPRRKKAA